MKQIRIMIIAFTLALMLCASSVQAQSEQHTVYLPVVNAINGIEYCGPFLPESEICR